MQQVTRKGRMPVIPIWPFVLIFALLALFGVSMLVVELNDKPIVSERPAPIREVVILPATPTKEATPEATATEEPKPTATAIPTQLVQEVVVRPTEEPTRISPSPTPTKPKPSPTPSPTTLPKIEVKWETPGPFGPYVRLSSGINVIVANPDGTVQVLEAGPSVGRTSISRDYGRTWITRPSTSNEIEFFGPLLDWNQVNRSNPWNWQRFADEKYGYLRVVPWAVAPTNNNYVLMAVSPKLLLSLDGGKSWREINTPPSGWDKGIIIGTVAIASHNGSLELFVGLAQDENSLLWHATIPISQLNI